MPLHKAKTAKKMRTNDPNKTIRTKQIIQGSGRVKMEEKLHKDILDEKEDLFCKIYATEREFFCNGTATYIEVYGMKYKRNGQEDYNSLRHEASDMLKEPRILRRIDKYLDLEGFNDSFVDKQLFKLVQQDADLKSKIAAISEYNKLKARIQSKVDITSQGDKVTPQIAIVNYADLE